MNGWKAKKLRTRAQRQWELGVMEGFGLLTDAMRQECITVGWNPLSIAYHEGLRQAREAKAQDRDKISGMPIQTWALVLAAATG